MLGFRSRFGGEPKVYRAPGRVNLIGEHTDYNDGFVLPAALELATYAAIAPRSDRTLRVHSLLMDEMVSFDLDEAEPKPRKDWSDYVRGVAVVLQNTGHRLAGADLLIDGDVPLGAGLSSSAAIEVATGYALLSNSGLPIDLTRLALACQRAENEFVGMRCGIMDQFIACHGAAGHALLIDCRSLERRLVSIDPRVRLVMCNTMVHHQHAAGEYNLRRRDCEEGVRRLSAVLPGIKALRDVTPEQLEEHADLLTPVIFRRCRHVVTENDRTVRAADALEAGDLVLVGRLDARIAREHAGRLRDKLSGGRCDGGGKCGCRRGLWRAHDGRRLRRLHDKPGRSACGGDVQGESGARLSRGDRT